MKIISFGSTYTFSLTQSEKKDKLIQIMEQRLPNHHIKSAQDDYMCVSVKEKSDKDVKNILEKCDFKFYKKSGKHELSKEDMKKALINYIKSDKHR